MIYVYATLAGLALGMVFAWQVQRVYRGAGPGGRHGIRHGCTRIRFSPYREVRHHIRGSLMSAPVRTYRVNRPPVAHHELTAATARYGVIAVLADRTLEVPRSLVL